MSTAGPTIDVHSHFIPPLLIDRIQKEGRQFLIDLKHDNGQPFVSFAGKARSKVIQDHLFDLDARLKWMDEQGIEIQIVSPWMDIAGYSLPPAEGLWMASTLNDLTADALARQRDRFRAMASLPMQEPELAAAELKRSVRELGMAGAEIGTSIPEANLDDPRFEPLWTMAEELQTVILIHPLHPVVGGVGGPDRYRLTNTIGNPTEETRAAVELIAGGVLARHPRLRFCLTHGGGFLPYQIGRQDRLHVVRSSSTSVGDRPPSSFLSSFLFDTILHSDEALLFLIQQVGPENVVLGSDYPFVMGDPAPLKTLTNAGVDESTILLIKGQNAFRSFLVSETPTNTRKDLPG